MSQALREMVELAVAANKKPPTVLPALKYDDGRTKQAFKDECDINKLVSRMWKDGTLSHLDKHEAEYGDFSDFDFHVAMNRLARGKSIFAELPAEVRREFDQDPAKFFAFVNDPENKDELAKRLPALAAPGRQRVELFGEQQRAQLTGAKPPDGPAQPAGEEPAPRSGAQGSPPEGGAGSGAGPAAPTAPASPPQGAGAAGNGPPAA